MSARHSRASELVHSPAPLERQRSDAERRLEAAVRRLERLGAERASLATALGELAERAERELADALDDRLRVERLVRRLEHLEADLAAELVEAIRREPPARVPRARSPRSDQRSGRESPPPPPPDDDEPSWEHLKDLYRRLAHRLHPDLATTDAERVRRGELMSRLNAAYAAEDHVELELLAVEVEPGTPAGPTPTRDEHAERRAGSLALAADRLERELALVRAGTAYRRLEAYRARTLAGADYFEEQRAAERERARQLGARIAPTVQRVEAAARALDAALAAKRGRRRAPQAFLPSVATARRSSSASRRFAAELGALPRWQIGWVVAAAFTELAGAPPEGMRTLRSWAARHEELRHVFGRTPPFDEALRAMPGCLELGCRLSGRGVRFGLQLRDPEHVVAVTDALADGGVRAVAADVLHALGPELDCPSCARTVHAVHVDRVGDLDPLHALLCPRCGAVLRSYRAFGRPAGVEALSEQARAIGLEEALTIRFGGVRVRLGVARAERRRLTARGLAALVSDALLGELSPGVESLQVRCAGRVLPPGAPVPRDAPLTVGVARGAGPSARALVEAVARRRRRRLRRR